MKPLPVLHHGVQLNAIESLRGVAALMIVIYHLAELVKLPLPALLSFVPTHFGLGVPLFYALSGFVLAYGYADRLDGRVHLRVFYTRRLFRILPLFYTLLAAWLAVNWLVWHSAPDPKTLLLNLTFLFGLVPGQHESLVWAGWSIGIEMLFYLIFPVVAVLTPGVRSALAAFGLGCFLSASTQGALQAASLGSYAYMNLITHLPAFLAGIAAYRLWQATGFARHRAGWGLFLAATGLAALLLRNDFVGWLVGSVYHFSPLHAWAVVFAGLILSTCLVSNPLLEWRPLRHFGQVSFSVYLLHPLCMLGLIKLDFVAWIASLTARPAYGFALGTGLVVLLVWALASLTYRWIEAPGIALGQRLARRFKPLPTP